MKAFTNFFGAATAAVFFSAASPSDAATLVYDNPVIYLAPGATATVGVTFYAPGLRTDADGWIIVDNPLPPTAIGELLFIQQQINLFFRQNVASPNPLANLDLTSVDSVHFNVGTISAFCIVCSIDAGPTTLEGVYTTKFAIGYIGPSTTGFDVTFADPGLLTVIVTSETPLPGSLVLFSSGLMAAAAVAGRSGKQRRRRMA